MFSKFNDKIFSKTFLDQIFSILKFTPNIRLSRTNVFTTIAENFRKLGYVDGKSLHGAPYDFREAQDEKFYIKVKNLIEITYKRNKNKKVVIIAHSYGGLIANIFLNKQRIAWKNHYLHVLFTISTPWTGSVKTVIGLMKGLNFGVPWTRPNEWKDLLRSYQSAISLLPSQKNWKSKQPFILTKDKNFTNNDIDTLIKVLNYPSSYQRWQFLSNIIDNIKPPKIKTYCYFGGGYKTIKQLDYTFTKFPNGQPKLTYELADGTVNLKSLNYCNTWKNSYIHISKQFQNNSHNGILHNLDMIENINKIILETEPLHDLPIVKRKISIKVYSC
ncbi:hypothetical protein A3Q56_06304 [Intoshia linei]|uniref:Uncharacterized protein n=1 Tax=Intoshia linei TaxID=1819745 RepID=A0A177AVG4_9BILA|nr:hypothetical protein A3Q56_06304 [Intoshia linei]